MRRIPRHSASNFDPFRNAKYSRVAQAPYHFSVLGGLKAIHAQESRRAAEAKADTVTVGLRAQRLTRAAELVAESVGETLTYYAFPDSHWIKIRTNNPLERIMKEIRRRTRVVGAFPNGRSYLNLAAARLRHIAGTHWSTRKYMSMAPFDALRNATHGAVA